MVIKEISDIIFMYNLHMKVLNTTSFNVHILSLHLFWWSHVGILFSSSYFHRWYRLASDISVMSFSWQHFFVLCTFNKTWAPIIKVSAAGCGDRSLTQTPVLKRQPSMVSFNCCAVAEVDVYQTWNLWRWVWCGPVVVQWYLFRMGKKQHLSQTKCRNRLAPFWLICSLVVWHKQLPLFNSNNHTPHFVLFSPTLNLAFHGLVSCWFRWVQ